MARGAPPTAIFHGKADRTVPYATVVAFSKAMQDAGNTCELFGYDAEQFRALDIGRIRDAAPDAVLRCEECRRILVRTPESGL